MDRSIASVRRVAKAVARRASWRALGFAVLSLALFVLAGDRGVRSATDPGIDPLDLLNLEAKANAFVVLDTSQSMSQTSYATSLNDYYTSDDHPLAKMAQAKSALTTVIDDNEETVAFAFATYTQAPDGLNATDRFVYFTDSVTSPGMVTSEITARNPTFARPVHRTSSDDFVQPAGVTNYRLYADHFVNGKVYTVQSDGDFCSDANGTATNPPTVTLIKLSSSSACSGTGVSEVSRATFTFAGAPVGAWGARNADCGGYNARVALAQCSVTDQLEGAGIANYLKPALEIDETTYSVKGYAENATTGAVTTQPPVVGLRASGYTPIAETLIDLQGIWSNLWDNRISTQTYKQSNFAIIVTDGDDTCASSNRTDLTNLDDNALRAAGEAAELYPLKLTTNPRTGEPYPASRFRTFVIFFGRGGNRDRADWVAWAGTGLQHADWGVQPTQAERDACLTCVDAFTAETADELTTALQAAINQGMTEGEFADRSTVASVYEYGGQPLNPEQRYETYAPLLVQSTWDMPGFLGHLKAFTSDGTSAVLEWDAGARLLEDRTVANSLSATARTFAALHGSATDENIATSSALIKRRIYTTTVDGVNAANGDYTVEKLVGASRADVKWERRALWPPDAEVLSGTFDDALGIPNDFATLQSDFKACTKTTASWPSGHGCATEDLATAKKEARERVLAYTAGADYRLTNGNVERDSTGEPLYLKRRWILADGTASGPAIALPPSRARTSAVLRHAPEWRYYTDGAGGQTGILGGFGLTMPAGSSTTSTALQPVMTVVYHAANDMLHAFRAGPCPSSSTCGTEDGGEELWGYVPYDQLAKLSLRVSKGSGATNATHIYTMAAPVRIADVFVPAEDGNYAGTTGSGVGISVTGVWRLVLFVGRGPGGKYLSALDVTVPGPTTTAALSTNPPIVMWNRTYSGMGETWSAPAVGPADATANGTEFVAYVGSGYSDNTGEGSWFYALNAITGELIYQHDVGGSSGATMRNVIVAGPALFQPNLLGADPSNTPVAGTDLGPYVYFNDTWGRIYRFATATPSIAPVIVQDYTAGQPFGVGMALLNPRDASLQDVPNIFATTGNDKRVETGPFKVIGRKDDPTVTNGDTSLFEIDMPTGYRGTVQPVAAFGSRHEGLALFAATKFTALEDAADCWSRYDSVLYILQTSDGTAAYDLPADGGRRLDIGSQKIVDLGAGGGQVRLGGGINPGRIPPPSTAPPQPPGPPTISIGPPLDLSGTGPLPPFPGTTSYKVGSTVCR